MIFEVAVLSFEGGFLFIAFFYPYLVLGISQI